MADLTFNTTPGAAVKRHMMICYLNTGSTSGQTPTITWSPIGKRVEDSSAEYDWGEETKNDILGNTYTTLKKPILKESFDPCDLDAGDSALLKIWNAAVKDQDISTLENMDVLLVHFYAGTAETAVFAERYPSSTIIPSSIGGSNNVGMPINVTFGGTRQVGTASVSSSGVVTFTAS